MATISDKNYSYQDIYTAKIEFVLNYQDIYLNSYPRKKAKDVKSIKAHLIKYSRKQIWRSR